MRISPSITMIGIKDETRKIAQDILSLLALKPGDHLRSSKFSSEFPGVDADEVFPGIYIGNRESAVNIKFLKSENINYVLNAAEGRKPGCVDTSEEFYKPHNIDYLGLKMFDVPQTNISKYFGTASDFIENSLLNGKVLVHCLMGMSRSATLVLAFLMKKENMTVVEAFKQVLLSRDIRPNDGFIKQLAEYQQVLKN